MNMERALIEKAAKEYAEREWGDAGLPGDDIIGRDMATPFIDGAEWLLKQHGWRAVNETLPPKRVYDWVLVRIVDANSKMELVPKIAELRSDGFWHPMDYDCKIGENFEDLLKVRVTHWHPIPPFSEK